MGELTIFFGVLLLALGVTAYYLTDSMHLAQLVPAVLGIVLVLCGLLANTEGQQGAHVVDAYCRNAGAFCPGVNW